MDLGVGREGRGCWVRGAPWIPGGGAAYKGCGRPGPGQGDRAATFVDSRNVPRDHPGQHSVPFLFPLYRGGSPGPRTWSSGPKAQPEAGERGTRPHALVTLSAVLLTLRQTAS